MRSEQTRQSASWSGYEEERRTQGADAKLDAETFGRLVSLHWDQLIGYLRRQTRDPHRAEDFAQETLLRAWETRDNYVETGTDSWIRWCLSIARRVVIDEWRRDRMAKAKMANQYRDFVEALRSQSCADDLMQRREQAALVERALQDLPEAQRRAMELLLEGRTGPQIAEEMSAPLNTVRTYLHRARVAVRASLKRRNRE